MNFSINSSEKRYRKTTDGNKNVLLTFRTLEDGTAKEVHLLNFRETPDRPSKRRDRFFVKQLAADGAFAGLLSPDDIEKATNEGVLPSPYVVDYKIPLDLGGSSDLRNMYVVDKDVAELMEVLYWHQIRTEVHAFQARQEQQKSNHKIGVSFASIPRVFTQEAFLKYILQHERKGLQKYLAKKKLAEEGAPERVSFQSLSDGGLLLRLIAPDVPPKGMQLSIIGVSPREWNDRSRLREEYTQLRPQIAMASLQRGDFDAWPKDMRQKIIDSDGHIPGVAQVTCHHILPILLGGDNKMKNICWLNDEVHKLIHSKFIAPLESCLHRISTGAGRLFFEMPVPEGVSLQTYTLVNGALVPNPMPQASQLRKTLQILSSSPTTVVRQHKRQKKRGSKKRPNKQIGG